MVKGVKKEDIYKGNQDRQVFLKRKNFKMAVRPIIKKKEDNIIICGAITWPHNIT